MGHPHTVITSCPLNFISESDFYASCSPRECDSHSRTNEETLSSAPSPQHPPRGPSRQRIPALFLERQEYFTSDRNKASALSPHFSPPLLPPVISSFHTSCFLTLILSLFIILPRSLIFLCHLFPLFFILFLKVFNGSVARDFLLKLKRHCTLQFIHNNPRFQWLERDERRGRERHLFHVKTKQLQALLV